LFTEAIRAGQLTPHQVEAQVCDEVDGLRFWVGEMADEGFVHIEPLRALGGVRSAAAGLWPSAQAAKRTIADTPAKRVAYVSWNS
jgi:hypothetical protein